jgi:nucleoside 2-deoxyribosyltransferase
MGNLLGGTRVYLAGPVEHDDHAKDWRTQITSSLLKYNVKVYDPLVKPSWLSDISKVDPKLYRKSLNGEPVGITINDVFDANKELRQVCLKMVSSADWIICWMPIKYTAGTFEEIYLAADIDKPVLFCMPDGIASTWVLQRFSTPQDMDHVFFRTWDQLIGHVDKLDNGSIKMDPLKWFSVCYDGFTNEKEKKCCKLLHD